MAIQSGTDKGPGKRPVIGFLLNSLFDGYEAAIWRSIVAAAEECDADLLCFLGGGLGDGSKRSALFHLVHPDTVDALVVLSASIGLLTGTDEVAALVSRMDPLPAVSLSERLPGLPSILVDNGAGIAQLIEHLVVDHGRRRIAYVGGPACSSEAALRFQAYRDTIARFQISFDPALLVEGDWGPASGIRAVRTLLDDRQVGLDAVLFSNDIMAIAALGELRRRGDVPGRIAVCGFDDIAEAAGSTPQLTTARQPLSEMGREAVHRAVAMARGQAIEPELVLPTQMVVRRSCGCSGGKERSGTPVAGVVPGALEPDGAACLEAAFPGLGARIGVPTWAKELAAALQGTGAAQERAFLRALEGLLKRGLDALPEPIEWLRVLRHALAVRGQSDDSRPAALAESAQVLVATMAASAQLTRSAEADQDARVLHRMSQPFPLPQGAFVENLLSAMEILGVRSFFLCQYLSADLAQASLVVGRDLDGIAELEEPAAPFSTHRLIPGTFSVRRRRAHVVLPIQSPDGPIGFALCEIGPMNGTAYEMLEHQLSTVSSMNELMAKLHVQQRRLVDAARLTGMAEVASGALHNVGNVLTTVKTSAEQIASFAEGPGGDGLLRAVELMLTHRDDLPGFFGSDPRAPQLVEYLDRISQQFAQGRSRLGEETRQLLDQLGFLHDTTQSLQEMARGGQSQLMREQIDVRTIVEAVLETQAPVLASYQVRVERQFGQGVPHLTTERAKLIHLLVNLVQNAVEAMRSKAEGERILSMGITAVDPGRVRITIGDNGEGIPPESIDKTFSIGLTTSADGRGFRLHSCALYAKQLGGSLGVSSPGRGRGATFVLELPSEPEAGFVATAVAGK